MLNMSKTKERDILHACIARLRALEPIQDVTVHPKTLAADVVRESGVEPDGLLVLDTAFGPVDYVIEIRKGITAQQLEHVLLQRRGFLKERLLLLNDYVPPPMAQRLAQAGIDFVDTVGNVHLHRPKQLFVFVQGKRPQTPTDRKPTRLFQPSGLQILFVVLSEPSNADLPYRDLAALSGVSLGTVSQVIQEMRHKGYLAQIGPKEWTLVRQQELIEQWVTGYAERLRAKLVIDRFRAPGRELELAVAKLAESSARDERLWALTGGWAADALTHHYRGDQLVAFIENWSHRFLQELDWLPSQDGPITLLRLFSPAVPSSEGHRNSHPVAHPLLVYAELLFGGTERELETAHLVYDAYIRPMVK
jgi:hypothetical protein